jgi:RNA polymerase sigma factor (sigma-70 family)
MKTPEQIISEYNRYILTVANRLGQPLFFDDLVQVGKLAAIQAYERLDHTKIKNDEKSYITSYIKGKMKNFLTSYLRTIQIPANKINEIHITTLSLSLPINDDGDSLENVIPSNDTYIYPEANNELKSLYLALDKLKPDYKELIQLYFNLNEKENTKPMTIEEIAQLKNTTRQNIAFKISNAISKLQKIMGVEVKKIRNTNK